MLFTLLARFSVVNSAHHQAVSDLPDCLICLQQSPDGIPETILHKDLPIIGFQWHPERLPAFLPAHFSDLVSILLRWGDFRILNLFLVSQLSCNLCHDLTDTFLLTVNDQIRILFIKRDPFLIDVI